jgi:LmbE family N-acetylglucosaminyl deacetylase
VTDPSGTGAVVFVHAHPDDEAIFTGGTMVRLAAVGVPVVLVVATGGELGEIRPGFEPAVTTPEALAEIRRDECRAAGALLGASDTVFLGYRDSGMAGDPANDDPECFWQAEVEAAGARLAEVLRSVGAVAVVGYDDFGIYGHPDHVQVARVTEAAARSAGVETVYAATVDREYLHFVESHVVEEAVLADDLGLVRSRIGVSSVEVTTAVDVRGVLAAKRAAMAAHASQIPESASALQLPEAHFADVYGTEWYLRAGPPGPLDGLRRR